MEGVGFTEVRVTEGWEMQGPVRADELSKVLARVDQARNSAANSRLYPGDILVVPWDDGKIRVQFERISRDQEGE